MPLIEVNYKMQLYVSEPIIRRALQKEGYHRRIVYKKPPISEKNRLLRLA